MSLKFMEMLSYVNSRRYLRQMQNLIVNKVPCGFFSGFQISPNVKAVVQSVKDYGINLNCVVVPVDEAKTVLDKSSIPIYTLNEIADGSVNVKNVFYEANFLNDSFTNFFKRYGISTLPLEDANGKENLYNFYLQHLSEIYSVYEMLVDEESKEVFRAYLTGNLTGRISDYKFAPESQYFLEGFLPAEGDIAIDGGAYDGATSRDFSMQGAKVYAFEMSTRNYKKCLARAEKYNFVIENIGLSNREGVEHYSDYGVGASKGGGVWKQGIS